MGDPTAFNYITPEEAAKMKAHDGIADVAYYRRLANKEVACQVCGQPAWKFGNLGMCFPCTTGETDASNDYELIGGAG